MRISTVIPCVNYDDFLALTLPRNLSVLENVTILTAPTDVRTLALAKAYDVATFVTDAWWTGPFNKARALNEWLDSVGETSAEDAWCLTLDADVLLPEGEALDPSALNSTTLYGARRRMCDTWAGWREFVTGRRSPTRFLLDVAPVWQGRIWRLPTVNAAGLYGCFQLWNRVKGAGAKRFPEMPTAAGYDVKFALSFPEHARSFLEGYEILHLGESGTNWSGRRSPRWTGPPTLIDHCA